MDTPPVVDQEILASPVEGAANQRLSSSSNSTNVPEINPIDGCVEPGSSVETSAIVDGPVNHAATNSTNVLETDSILLMLFHL